MWCPCGQSPLETRPPFPHPLERATQPSVGTPPTQSGGLDSEDTSPTSLEGVGLGAAAIDLRTYRVIAEVPPPRKHLWSVTPRLKVSQLQSAHLSPHSSQEHPLPFPLALSLQLHVGPSGCDTGAFSCTAGQCQPGGDSPSTGSWRPDGRTRRGAHLLWLGVNHPPSCLQPLLSLLHSAAPSWE